MGNTAIITLSSNPITAGFALNQTIVISGFAAGDTYFNQGVLQPFSSTVTIIGISSTTISFPLTHANASAATNGSVFQMGNVSTPCAPLASIFSDAALATPITQPGFISSGIGNYGFFINPGSYAIQFYGSGVTTYLQPLTLTEVFANGNNAFTGNNTFSGTTTLSGTTNIGNGNSFAPFTFSNHNNLCWAGPGTTPTIDQAVTACAGFAGSMVEISPGYSGPESALLVTTSLGYQVYPGNPSVVIFDRRAPQGAAGNPAATPLYRMAWGSRWDGELSTEYVNYWSTGVIPDSTTTLASANWVGSGATFPANNGSLQAASAVTILHDAVTINGSTSPVVGQDAEVWLDETSLTGGPLPFARAYNGQCLINRANAVGVTTQCSAYHASNLSIIGGATATVTNNFLIDADPASGGTTLNYSYHSGGNFLFENNSAIDVKDSGGTARHSILWGSDNRTDFFALANLTCCGAASFNFKNQGGTALFSIFSNRIQSTVAHEFFGNLLLDGSGSGTVTLAVPAAAGSNTATFQAATGTVAYNPPAATGTDLGSASLPWANLWLGTAATNNFKFQPAATAAARTISIPDPLGNTSLPLTIVSGTKALNTASITTATCDGGAAVAATGTLSTDAVDWSFNAAPTATNKYGAFLVVYAVPSANTVTFYTCNPSATTSTPTAMTVNWSVRRP